MTRRCWMTLCFIMNIFQLYSRNISNGNLSSLTKQRNSRKFPWGVHLHDSHIPGILDNHDLAERVQHAAKQISHQCMFVCVHMLDCMYMCTHKHMYVCGDWKCLQKLMQAWEDETFAWLRHSAAALTKKLPTVQWGSRLRYGAYNWPPIILI